MKFKIQVPADVRLAMKVANAVALEVSDGSMPGLLSIDGATFRYEGGTTIKVNIVELTQFLPSYMRDTFKDRVVTHCEVRYRPEDAQAKSEEHWDHIKLAELKSRRNWHGPHVMALEDIKGEIGVFIDFTHGTGGYVEVDFCGDVAGDYRLAHVVEYARLIPESLKAAKAKAKRLLDQELAKLAAEDAANNDN